VFGSNSQLRALAEVYAQADNGAKFVRDFVRGLDQGDEPGPLRRLIDPGSMFDRPLAQPHRRRFAVTAVGVRRLHRWRRRGVALGHD
jgi:hypothetical protein